MTRLTAAFATALLFLVTSSVTFAQTPQTSSAFDFTRLYASGLDDPNASPGIGASGDLMFMTKYTQPNGTNYVIATFGDTLAGSHLLGNWIGWSTDFDLSDGMDFHYKINGWSIGQGMTPRKFSQPPPNPSDPDANETQIWFSRSFVLGQDIYTYYGSFAQGHVGLGTGLAVIRGGIADFNNMPEFERVSKATFWFPPGYFLDGHPIIKTESDGITYLYLFNAFGVQRVPTTQVENMNAYTKWAGTGLGWVPNSAPVFAQAMWDQSTDFALRATCEWNPYLQKWVSIYSPFNSADGRHSQLAYRTADQITGPWSESKVIYYGFSASEGANPGPGDCYSPVYRSFFDKDGGKTIYTFFSQGGSQGAIPLFEYTFDHTVTSTKRTRIADFAPQGLDETQNLYKDGTATFFFRDTHQINTTNGNIIRTYPNSSLYTTTDFDVANGLSFDEALKYKPLPAEPGEGKVWLTAPMAKQGFDYVGTFFKKFGTAGNALGTGFAYTEAPHFHRTFYRAGGTLSPASLISRISQVVDQTNTTVVINDENDFEGAVYLAKANTSGVSSATALGQALTTESSYQFSTIGINPAGYVARLWSNDPNQAVEIFDNAFHPSIFRDDYTGNWIALYTTKSSASGANSQLTMRQASRLIGPWSDPVVLYTLSNGSGTTGRLHNAKYLMGFDKEGGKVMYVSASDFQAPQGVDIYEVRLR